MSRVLSRMGAFCLVCAAGLATSGAATLEEALSAPYLSELRGAAKADRILWIEEARGRRNIWAADGPQYTPLVLTHYDGDDGQELADLAMNPEASVIAYVRGGARNKEGISPNPTADPKGAKQEVWALTKGEKEPRRIGEGSNPVISPDGRSVVFLKEGQFFISPLDRSAEPKQLFHAKGKMRSATWSPDGTRLAFVSARGDDRAFAGVYDLKREKLTWLSPDFQVDHAPTWSPDGKRIAFLRFPTHGLTRSSEHEPALPFSIWVADPETGVGRAIWESPDQTATFTQFYERVPLLWAAGDHLLFYWERDGWKRVYSIAARGGEPTPLTPTGCEAEDSALSNHGAELLFASNCGDSDRRHVWTVPILGGSATQLTTGEGLEWGPTAVNGGAAIAFLQATALRPAQPVALRAGDRVSRVVELESVKHFPANALVAPRSIAFKSLDGTTVHGQLFVRSDLVRGERHPGVLYLHGGPVRQMLVGWHYLRYYHYCYAMNQFLASQGYVVLALNYRTGIGYGRAFRRIPKGGARGAAEYQDVVAAGKYLQRLENVDPKRVALWGGSYGGYLTAMGLGRDSKLFSAGVDMHGVHDWSYMMDWTREPPSKEREALLATARASSPVSATSSWSSPVLFIHGDDDPTVAFGQTSELIARLRTRPQVHIETLALPDEVHSFLRYDTWLRAFRATTDFFDRILKNSSQSKLRAGTGPSMQ